MKKGLLIILSGPSGVGKGTVRAEIFKHNSLNLSYSVSMTTREKRKGEIDGVDYYFVSEEEFQDNIDRGNFLEYTQFVGHSYGTPLDKVEEKLNQGLNVFLEIEVVGATQVLSKVKGKNVISFFLMPPSLKTLENRIKGRKTEPIEIIKKRIAKGKKEMSYASKYDYIIINDRVKTAANKIVSIIEKELKK